MYTRRFAFAIEQAAQHTIFNTSTIERAIATLRHSGMLGGEFGKGRPGPDLTVQHAATILIGVTAAPAAARAAEAASRYGDLCLAIEDDALKSRYGATFGEAVANVLGPLVSTCEEITIIKTWPDAEVVMSEDDRQIRLRYGYIGSPDPRETTIGYEAIVLRSNFLRALAQDLTKPGDGETGATNR